MPVLEFICATCGPDNRLVPLEHDSVKCKCGEYMKRAERGYRRPRHKRMGTGL